TLKSKWLMPALLSRFTFSRRTLMHENRRQILEMLAAGQINADEAERLIAALEKGQPTAASDGPKAKPRYLRVVVRSDEGDNPNDPSMVNIRVPMQLL